MKLPYQAKWEREIAEMRRILLGLGLTEELKWGKPTFLVGEGNVCILQGFRDFFGLGFFQGALLKDAKKLLFQPGRVQAARFLKFTSVKEIVAQEATIKAYVREAMAAEKAGRRVELKTPDYPIPAELTERLGREPRLKKAFDALTPGRQRSYLYHFADAKQAATRVARIEKAVPGILAGRGFLERR